MLRIMRDYAGSWMIKFILGAIVLVFVFWGVGSFDSGNAAKVAVVNDRVITVEEYREAYNNLVEQMRRNFGDNLDDDMLKALNVRRQALDRLIDETLLLQEAEDLDFRVTDEELASAIRNIEAFQQAGVFDSRLYQNILGRLRMTPEQFEIAQKRAMLSAKVRDFVTRTVQVSDAELSSWYRWQNAQVDLAFVRFAPAAYSSVTVSEEEVKRRFEENPEAYKTEKMVKVRYLKIAPEDFLSQVSVPPEELKKYYEENPEEFHQPKTVEARHILFKVSQEADEQTVEEKRKKAVEVLKMAKAGEDFAELAKRYSEGPSRSQGGYLGTFSRQEMVAPFSEKAFSMSAGEVDGPVRTRFGWHLIKVEKVNEASKETFEEAREKIRKKLALAEARNLAYDAAGEVYDVSFEGDDLLQAAEERGLSLKTTDFFTRTGPDIDIENRVEFARASFALAPMVISEIKEFKDGYYLLQVVESKPAQVPEYDAVAEEVRADLIAEKQKEMARTDAEAFLQALKKDGATMAGKSAAEGKTLRTTGFFKRNEQIPQIGYTPEIAQAVFLLTEDAPLVPEVLEANNVHYVIRLQSRKEPSPEGLEAQKDDIARRLLQQKRQEAFQQWLSDVKARSKIEIEESFIE